MNILLFAMTILILLASMAYTSLDSFRTVQISKKEFEVYVKENERTFFTKAYKKWYDKINDKKGSSGKNRASKGVAELSFFPLLNSKEREQNRDKVKDLMAICENLILNLFKDQPNVQKMLENDPAIITRFFHALLAAADKMTQQTKIKSIEELASIELQEEDLKTFRYEIFKENNLPGETKTYSLLDELTALPGTTRLYLASKNLLKAVFHDDAIVEQIIEKREFLHKAIKSKKSGMDPAQAAIEFKNFVKELAPSLNDSLFDYIITKTKSKK